MASSTVIEVVIVFFVAAVVVLFVLPIVAAGADAIVFVDDWSGGAYVPLVVALNVPTPTNRTNSVVIQCDTNYLIRKRQILWWTFLPVNENQTEPERKRQRGNHTVKCREWIWRESVH
jgi:hypothetical protein